MDVNSWTQFGIAGVLLFMTFQYIIKPIVSTFVERRKNGDSPIKSESSLRMQDQINALYEWHKVRDGKGNFVWWSNTLADSMAELNENIKTLIVKLDKLETADPDSMKELTRSIKILNRNLDKLGRDSHVLDSMS